MTLLHFHRVAGLTLASELLLPAPRISPTPDFDVELSFGSVTPHPCHDSAPEGFHVEAGQFRIWNDLGQRFHVAEGRSIRLDMAPEAMDALHYSLVIGPLFAALFHQREELPLHGAAVAFGGRAHVFLGDSGQGKSTLSSLLCAHGAEAMADDMTVVRWGEGGGMVHPAFTHGKLDEATAALHRDRGRRLTSSLHPGGHWARLADGVARVEACPLAEIHLLGGEPSDEGAPLRGAPMVERLLGLVTGMAMDLHRHRARSLMDDLTKLAAAFSLHPLPRCKTLCEREEQARELLRRWEAGAQRAVVEAGAPS